MKNFDSINMSMYTNKVIGSSPESKSAEKYVHTLGGNMNGSKLSRRFIHHTYTHQNDEKREI